MIYIFFMIKQKIIEKKGLLEMDKIKIIKKIENKTGLSEKYGLVNR